MSRYAKYVSADLQERLSEFQKENTLSLRAELAVMQDIAGKAIAAHEKANEIAVAVEDPAQRIRLQSIASENLYGALNQVRDMTLAASRVQELTRAVDLTVVNTLVAQLFDVLDRELHRSDISDPDRVLAILQHAARTEMLTVDAVAHTRLTPEKLDREVKAMHKSVPEVYAPESESEYGAHEMNGHAHNDEEEVA